MAFSKGQSGNPAGKPPGARHRASMAAEALLDGEVQALTRKAIERALEGDGVALRLCLESSCRHEKIGRLNLTCRQSRRRLMWLTRSGQ
jgi:Family of unknown function (DUF5681)